MRRRASWLVLPLLAALAVLTLLVSTWFFLPLLLLAGFEATLFWREVVAPRRKAGRPRHGDD